MRELLIRLLLAAVAVVAIALAQSANAQQAAENPGPNRPRQQQVSAASQSPPQHDANPPSSSDPQTQVALAFTGRVVKEKGQFVLNDSVTKVSYRFDDQSKAKQYLGKQVKVVGKLDMNSNTIHVDSIEPLS